MSTTTLSQRVPAARPPSESVRALPIAVNLVFIAGASLLFNFFPQRVGYWVSALDPDSFVPVLSPGFGGPTLLLLNLWWGLAFSLGVINLVRRRWTPATNWADVGVQALGAAALAVLAVDGSIGTKPWAEVSIQSVLLLACLGMSIAAARKAMRLLRP